MSHQTNKQTNKYKNPEAIALMERGEGQGLLFHEQCFVYIDLENQQYQQKSRK